MLSLLATLTLIGCRLLNAVKLLQAACAKRSTAYMIYMLLGICAFLDRKPANILQPPSQLLAELG